MWLGLGIVFSAFLCPRLWSASKWTKLESPEFVIISDASSKDVVEFAASYAAFRIGFRDVFQLSESLPRTEILLFRRDTDFEKRVPKPVQNDGRRTIIHSGDVDGSVLLALAVDGDRWSALSIAFEFEALWGIQRLGYAMPLWATQGAGEVLSTLEQRKGICRIGARGNRFASLPSSQLLPWEKFFGTSSGSQAYDGKNANGIFHNQAWMLMHWVLLKDEHGAKRFRELASRLRTTRAIEAMEEVMSTSRKDFTREISKHLHHFKERTVSFDDAALRANFKISPAADFEVKVSLGNLAYTNRDFALARAEIAAAAQLEPDAAIVKEASARLALHDDDPRSAAEFYRQAIAAGSKNPRAYTYSAYARLNESSTGGPDYMGAGGKNVYDAIEELRRAIQLDPGNVWAYQQLGRAFFLAQKMPEGAIEELSKGIGSTEQSSHVLHYRALLHRRNEQLDEYLADLKQFASYPDLNDALREKRLAQWKESFVEILQSRITASVKAGRFDEAMSTIADAKKRDADGELTGAINHLEQWVDENRDLRALRKAAAANDWPAVLKQAQVFLATWPNSSAITQVKKLLTQAEKAVPSI